MDMQLKSRKKYILLFIILFLLGISIFPIHSTAAVLTSEDFVIRDPNILYYNNMYYLTGTSSWNGFLGYNSTDLVHWEEQGLIYEKSEANAWAQKLFWADEFFYNNNKFFLFYTALNDTNHRGTGVAVSDYPMGPYSDLIGHSLTPPQYHCLDGHPFRDIDGKYYLFYVYEWINPEANGIGELWVQEMSPDFTELMGNPISLFKGGDAKWSSGVVDGPSMLYYNNKYFLFWSSFNQLNYGKYSVSYAYSDSILGPYIQAEEPLITTDGGHSSWFIEQETGKMLITYHSPNRGPERVQIKELLWSDVHGKWYVSPLDEWGVLGPYPEEVLIILEYSAIPILGITFISLIGYKTLKRRKG